MKSYIGIDPGQTGGIAIISGRHINLMAMAVGGKEIDCQAVADWLYVNLRNQDQDPVAYLEKVSSMPGQGVKSTFKFGMNYGMMMGILGALMVPYYLVTPQSWKKVVLAGLPWKGNKEAAVDYCRRAYPDVSLLATSLSRKAHSGMADALCIAVYASLNHK